ncbi:hypothetical protein L286_23350 [Sphingobium sp. HDIP04]|nr:hypothetical protein L286_23350 [Sphingobium sp. HDIP04]
MFQPYPLTAIATGNERAEKPAIHLAQFKHIGMTWRSNGNGNIWIRGDFGQDRVVDFVSLLQANAQPGTTIRIRLGASQAQVDGSAPYDSGALPFISPAITREDGLYHSHHELPGSVTARWWRIDIGGHNGDFEAAKAVFGKKITPARYYDRNFEFGVQDLGSVDFGRWGVPEEEEGLIFRTVTFKLSWIPGAEYEANWRPMIEKVGRRQPVFLCFDPQATTARQAKTYFGVFRDPPFATASVKPGTFAQEFALLSFI